MIFFTESSLIHGNHDVLAIQRRERITASGPDGYPDPPVCNPNTADNLVTTFLYKLLTTLGYTTRTGQSKRSPRSFASRDHFHSPGGNRHRTLSSGGVAAPHRGSYTRTGGIWRHERKPGFGPRKFPAPLP